MLLSRGCKLIAVLTFAFVLTLARDGRSQAYQCGDFNGDAVVSINDIVHLINYLFAGGIPPVDVSHGDVNCDHRTNITDGVFMVNYIFAGGVLPCTGCQTSVVFLTDLNVTPAGTFINTPTQITATIAIEPNVLLDPNSVFVYQVDLSGAVIGTMAQLVDNGDLNAGDEIDGDWVFSCRFAVYEPVPVVRRWIASAVAVTPQGSLVSRSQTYFFQVNQTFTEDQYLTQVDGRLDADSIYNQLQSASPAAAKAAAVAYLNTRAEVASAGVTPDSQMIWIEYTDGSEAGIYTPTDVLPVLGGDRVPHRDDLPLRIVPPTLNTTPFSQVPPQLPPANKEPQDVVVVSSNRALLLSPFHTWLNSLAPNLDPLPAIAQELENNECPQFDVTVLTDAAAGVEAFRTLETYGTIGMITHGAVWNDNRVVIATGEQASFWKDLGYFSDLHSWGPNRLIKVMIEGADHYAITPTFVTHYSETPFPNSIVYIAACQGLKNTTLSTAFISNGAGIVLGYDETVNAGYAVGVTIDFFEEMVGNQSSALEAYNSVNPKIDPIGAEHAEFVYVTTATDVIYEDNLYNGGFEQGALTGWTPEGDGRVITGLGPEVPVEGSYMGIISTGLGFTTATGSIRQSFCLPAGATKLKLAYNFYSEEFLEWCGSVFQDYFQITITPAGGSPTQLLYQHVDDLCGMVVPAPIVFDRGGVYMTGWLYPEFDISAFAGQAVTVEFSAGDIGDSIYDTAILIDMISIQ